MITCHYHAAVSLPVCFYQILKTSNATGVVPLRALLCSYKCFNVKGHDYYGVAFPWWLKPAGHLQSVYLNVHRQQASSYSVPNIHKWMQHYVPNICRKCTWVYISNFFMFVSCLPLVFLMYYLMYIHQKALYYIYVWPDLYKTDNVSENTVIFLLFLVQSSIIQQRKSVSY